MTLSIAGESLAQQCSAQSTLTMISSIVIREKPDSMLFCSEPIDILIMILSFLIGKKAG